MSMLNQNFPKKVIAKPGDTLYMIAYNHKIKLKDLVETNPDIKYPYWLYPGQPVYLPENTIDIHHNQNRASGEAS